MYAQRRYNLAVVIATSLILLLAGNVAAQTLDSDSENVGLEVSGASVTVTPTPTETVTPIETPTATATETPTPTPTEVANEDCPLKPDNARRIDPNAVASQQAPLGTPCNPLTNKVAGPVTQLPNTGVGNQGGSINIDSAILVSAGIILIGSAGAMVKQRS